MTGSCRPLGIFKAVSHSALRKMSLEPDQRTAEQSIILAAVSFFFLSFSVVPWSLYNVIVTIMYRIVSCTTDIFDVPVPMIEAWHHVPAASEISGRIPHSFRHKFAQLLPSCYPLAPNGAHLVAFCRICVAFSLCHDIVYIRLVHFLFRTRVSDHMSPPFDILCCTVGENGPIASSHNSSEFARSNTWL